MADALASGASDRKVMEVRLLSRPPLAQNACMRVDVALGNLLARREREFDIHFRVGPTSNHLVTVRLWR